MPLQWKPNANGSQSALGPSGDDYALVKTDHLYKPLYVLYVNGREVITARSEAKAKAEAERIESL